MTLKCGGGVFNDGGVVHIENATLSNNVVVGANENTGVIQEIEANDTFATAQDLSSAAFVLIDNPIIFNSPTVPHITIQGTGNDTFDFYSFVVETPGAVGTFDMDNLSVPAANFFDTELDLFDSVGNLLASNDDITPIDPGSGSGAPIVAPTTTLDAGIFNFTFTTAGTYVIGVSEFPSTGSNGGVITGEVPPNGGQYNLHISISGQQVNQNSDALGGPDDGGAGLFNNNGIVTVSDTDIVSNSTASDNLNGGGILNVGQ